MNCYLVNNETGLVENTIVANPEIDKAPDGYSLVPMEEIITVESITDISRDI